MKRAVIHLSEAEAVATNVATLLARVRSGTEIVIENESRLIAIFRALDPIPRTIIECIELLPEDSTGVIDPDFSRDVAIAVESESQCEPLSPPEWE